MVPAAGCECEEHIALYIASRLRLYFLAEGMAQLLFKNNSYYYYTPLFPFVKTFFRCRQKAIAIDNPAAITYNREKKEVTSCA